MKYLYAALGRPVVAALVTFWLLFFGSVVAWAQEAAEPGVDFFVSVARWVYEQAQAGNWMVVAAAVVLLAMVVVRRYFGDRIPKRLVPFIAIAAGIALQGLTAVIAGKPPLPAVMAGLVTGLSSTGLWEALGPKPARNEAGSSKANSDPSAPPAEERQ